VQSPRLEWRPTGSQLRQQQQGAASVPRRLPADAHARRHCARRLAEHPGLCGAAAQGAAAARGARRVRGLRGAFGPHLAGQGGGAERAEGERGPGPLQLLSLHGARAGGEQGPQPGGAGRDQERPRRCARVPHRAARPRHQVLAPRLAARARQGAGLREPGGRQRSGLASQRSPGQRCVIVSFLYFCFGNSFFQLN